METETAPVDPLEVEPSDAPVRQRPSTLDLAILGYVAALLVVWSPLFYLGLLTPRMAIVFVGLGPGLVVMAGLARRGDHSARWAVGYLAWALVAVAVSRHPRAAFVATYGTDIGWIYLAGYLSAWALGRRLGPEGRRVLPGVLLVGLLVNAFFGILESAITPTGDLATEGGRVHGLMSNSLFLGGLLVGGLALTGYLAAKHQDRLILFLALVIPLAMAVNLTGSRAALVGGSALAVIAAYVAAGEDRSVALRTAGLVAVVVVLGFALSLPLQGDESSSSRISDTSESGGYTSRGIMWNLALKSVAERPIAGWGPGRFREATSPRISAEFVRAEGPDKLFYDAHNIVVENLVATGIVGLILLGGFAWSQVRRCRGPLAWFAGGVALTWLFNPVSICTGALALLALGAAARHDPAEDPVPGRSVVPARVVGALLAALGLVAGVRLLWADALLDKGVASGDLSTVEHASRLVPDDAVITNIVTEARSRVAADNDTAANKAAVIAGARESARLDPTNVHWAVVLGYSELLFGPGPKAERLDRAQAQFEHALELNPQSVEAMRGLMLVANTRHDRADVIYWNKRLHAVNVDDPLPPASTKRSGG